MTLIVQDSLFSLRSQNGFHGTHAAKYPQAAFSALSKSLQFEWTYLQRVVHDCSAAFAPVWDALNTFSGQQFLKDLFLKLKNIYSHFLPKWVVWEYEILY